MEFNLFVKSHCDMDFIKFNDSIRIIKHYYTWEINLLLRFQQDFKLILSNDFKFFCLRVKFYNFLLELID